MAQGQLRAAGEKVALITGASGGIGLAAGVALIRAGYRVFGTSRQAKPGEMRQGIHMLRCDVTDDESVKLLVKEVIGLAGRIDVLVNNAGLSRYRPFATMTGDDWDVVLNVDLKGVFFCSQAVAPHMTRQHYGRIVNIASALGTGAAPHNTAGSPGGSSAYASAKAGVIMLTKTLARELGPAGVTVNCVAPGTFLTPMSAMTRSPEEVQAHLDHRKKTVVLERIGTLEELASCVLFFASDDSSYVTGHTLFADGGRSDRM